MALLGKEVSTGWSVKKDIQSAVSKEQRNISSKIMILGFSETTQEYNVESPSIKGFEEKQERLGYEEGKKEHES